MMAKCSKVTPRALTNQNQDGNKKVPGKGFTWHFINSIFEMQIDKLWMSDAISTIKVIHNDWVNKHKNTWTVQSVKIKSYNVCHEISDTVHSNLKINSIEFADEFKWIHWWILMSILMNFNEFVAEF